jgi:pimeloyl-ACP methyl ester carboxylesterase
MLPTRSEAFNAMENNLEVAVHDKPATMAPEANRATTRRVANDHVLIGKADRIPVPAPAIVVSVGPVVLPAPGRIVDLEVRVTAPATGRDLPIILLSHGGGTSNFLSSFRGFGPLVDFWAAHGFVVIQPTHLTSKSLGLGPTTPGFPLFWRSRVDDLTQILDQLGLIEDAVPTIKGRLDRGRVAVAGHSFGGQTAGMLLGEQFTDDDGTVVRLREARIKAGVLLAATGAGGDHLGPGSAKFACLRTADFAEMTTAALVVVGDKDINADLSSRGADYHADAYALSPGPKCLLTLPGGEHMLGGISGYDAAGTTDESPERVAIVQRMSWAYLRSEFYPNDPAWSSACAALAELDDLGRVDCKY